MNEGAGQGPIGQAALAAVIFNRIKYPKGNFEDAVDIINCIELTVIPVGGKEGSWLEKDLRTKLWGAERYPKIETSAYGGADVVTRQILISIARTAARI